MMEKLINIDHPVFEVSQTPPLMSDLNQVTEDHRWSDFLVELTRIQVARLPETKSNLEALLSSELDPERRALLYAGISRYYKGVGKLSKTAKMLAHAQVLLKDQNAGDALAFVQLEMAILLGITGNVSAAEQIFTDIEKLTHSPYLQHYSRFRLLELKMRKQPQENIQAIEDSLSYFQETGDFNAVANHYKALGNAQRLLGDYEKALSLYLKGTETALNHKLPHIVDAIEHDIAMLYYRQGQSDTAAIRLKTLSEETANYYIKVIALSNLGFIELKQRRTDLAMTSFQDALEIATQHGVYHRMTGLSHYLGEIHEELGDLNKSALLHDQAFRAAMNMVENHFPCAGDTLRAIKGYHKFNSIHSKVSPEKMSKDLIHWDQLLARNFKDVKSLFQAALLKEQVALQGSKKQAASHLGLSTRAVFTIEDRTARHQDDPLAETLKSYIHLHKNLNWKEVNQRFEQEFLHKAFEEVGENTSELAKRLEISYSSAAGKIKTLKQNT